MEEERLKPLIMTEMDANDQSACGYMLPLEGRIMRRDP